MGEVIEINAMEKILLLDEWKDSGEGRPWGRLRHFVASERVNAVGRQCPVGLHVAMQGESDLLEIVCTLSAGCGFPDPLDGRNQERDQDRDDRDDDEQFDQRKTVTSYAHSAPPLRKGN